MSLKIAIIYGSVRSERLGLRAARYVETKLKSKGHITTIIDPLEYNLPLLDKMYKEYNNDKNGKAPDNMEKLSNLLKDSDAFIIVSGEYNHSIPPALSNLLDHFMPEYFWKPSAIVSYSTGGFGGVRAAVQLRSMLSELGMPSIPSTFPISKVHESLSEEGLDNEGSYDKRIGRFIDELEWYANALREQRNKGVPY